MLIKSINCELNTRQMLYFIRGNFMQRFSALNYRCYMIDRISHKLNKLANVLLFSYSFNEFLNHQSLLRYRIITRFVRRFHIPVNRSTHVMQCLHSQTPMSNVYVRVYPVRRYLIPVRPQGCLLKGLSNTPKEQHLGVR